MTRFFFNLHECGAVIVDEEGRELAGLDRARAEAVTAARAVMSDELLSGRLCLACAIEIRDEQGEVLLTVPFRDTVEISGLDG